jgi:hypothetical protein
MSLTVILVPCNIERSLETLHIKCESRTLDDIVAGHIAPDSTVNVIKTLLLRPSDGVPGVYVHHDPSNSDPNIRATRLAMACGLLSMRIKGDVVISRTGGNSLTVDEISSACCISADLREDILSVLNKKHEFFKIPDWLADASKSNYHDGAVLSRLNEAMKKSIDVRNDDDDDDDDDDDFNSRSDFSPIQSPASLAECAKENVGCVFVATVPLCLQCRRPASKLCKCLAAYFCEEPMTCRRDW